MRCPCMCMYASFNDQYYNLSLQHAEFRFSLLYLTKSLQYQMYIYRIGSKERRVTKERLVSKERRGSGAVDK